VKPPYAKMQPSIETGDLELLLALIRGRTLAGAAERLQVDTSTVFRSLKKCEKTLGERLFERGRQGYLPTELALTLAGHAERIESQLQEAREAAFDNRDEPSGTLRVTTTDTILHGLLLPVLRAFSEAYPGIELELVASNAFANLNSRDADVAVRATRRPPEHLVGTRLATISAGIFASRVYLERQSQPLQLDRLDWIAPDDSLPEYPSVTWMRKHYPQVIPKFRCNSILSVAGAIVYGLGIGVVPAFLLKDNPGIEDIGGPLPELDTELWILAHPDIRHLHRVKLLFDFLRENLKI
jgi:DNA-binding transcriptional LysR family regulator